MTEELKQWILHTSDVTVPLSEKEIITEYMKFSDSSIASDWCLACLVHTLGNEAKVKEKYPELFI